MSTFLLLTITGLGLGAMYFLIASGLSLIYGLMGVLNFAHGVFLTVTAYALWFTESKLGGLAVLPRFLIAALVGLVVAVVFAALYGAVLIWCSTAVTSSRRSSRSGSRSRSQRS